MKREATFLIAIALLMNAAPLVWAQDGELLDKDLETLLEDEKPASEVKSAESTEKSTESPTSKTTEEPSEATEEAPGEFADAQDLDTLDKSDGESVLEPEEPVETVSTEEKVEEDPLDKMKVSNEETADELEGLKKDIGDSDEFIPAKSDSKEEAAKAEKPKEADKSPEIAKKQEELPAVFDVGREERDLLAVAKNIQGQISDNEWNEVATAAKVDTYTVVTNDWLFKISKKLFGSGYFYPKIWSLNAYITNPHFIEPGMVLSFTTGSGANPPQVKLGSFTDDELNAVPGSIGTTNAEDLANFGDDAKPKWLDEKSELEKQGVYFQYASEETMDDLTKVGEVALDLAKRKYQELLGL